jgi:hypothetical protein
MGVAGGVAIGVGVGSGVGVVVGGVDSGVDDGSGVSVGMTVGTGVADGMGVGPGVGVRRGVAVGCSVVVGDGDGEGAIDADGLGELGSADALEVDAGVAMAGGVEDEPGVIEVDAPGSTPGMVAEGDGVASAPFDAPSDLEGSRLIATTRMKAKPPRAIAMSRQPRGRRAPSDPAASPNVPPRRTTARRRGVSAGGRGSASGPGDGDAAVPATTIRDGRMIRCGEVTAAATAATSAS